MKQFKNFRGFFRSILDRNGKQFFPNPIVRRRIQLVLGILDIILGVILIFLGIIGFLLPVIPGFLFFFLGVLLVSPHHGRKILSGTKKLIHKFRSRK